MVQPKTGKRTLGVQLAKDGGKLIGQQAGHNIYTRPYDDMLRHFSGRAVSGTVVGEWLAGKWRMSLSQAAYYRRHAIFEGKVEVLRKSKTGQVLNMRFK